MTDKRLSGLISDWGGFEKLIESLHQSDGVTVERDVTLVGKSGAPRQIDVLIRHQQGLYEHLIIVECKYWKKSVSRLHVDALATTVQQVGAAKGVIFSTVGFQSGAIMEAPQHSIDLYTLREVSDIEWGSPGRHIDCWIHVISMAVGNLDMQGGYRYSLVNTTNVAIELSFDGDESHKTSIEAHNRPNKSLESLLIDLSNETLEKVYLRRPFVFESGMDGGIVRQTITVKYEPEQPLMLFSGGGVTFFPRLSFTLGIELNQTRFTYDRAEPFLFALIVEDHVRKRLVAASRRKNSDGTTLQPINSSGEIQTDQLFLNGSIISCIVKGMATFEPFIGMELGKVVEFTLPENALP